MTTAPPPSPRLARASALMTEGERLREAGEFEAAERAYLKAAALAPTAASPLHNLGIVHQLAGDYPRAEQAFRRALELEPGRPASRAALGAVLLGQGRYVEGFTHYDSWRDLPEHRERAAGAAGPLLSAFSLPRWRGEPLADKRLLVLSEEGFGDQIMYARFAKLAQAAGAEVVWLCTPSLARLFERCLGIRAAPWDRGSDLGRFDFCIPSSSLARPFFPPLEKPPAAPYLTPPPPSRAAGVTLGVAVSGDPRHLNDRHRSLPPELAAELLALPGAVDLSPAITGARDFYDTAQVMTGLDLVITVDTSAAHLAGAMGKSCWVLLPAYGTDWRWGRAGDGCAWYDSLRLFRQPRPGAWRPVLDAVAAALDKGVNSKG